MPRLIDADALLEKVKTIHKAVDTSEINQCYDTGFHSATSQVQGLIAYMPTIGPVHAAGACYCSECIWRGREECAMFYRCDCGEQHTWETDNDFCSYGEPKGEYR